MKREHLKDLLDRLPGARPQPGDVWALGGTMEASLFAEAGAEMLTIARVERVELRPDYAVLVGAKGEMLFFPYDKIAGLRIESRDGPASGGTSRSPPGFGAR